MTAAEVLESPVTKFQRDSAVEALEPGVYRARMARDWFIPVGPNGGYVAAVVVRAMQDAVGDAGRHARSLTLHYLRSPAEGDVTLFVTVERAGRRMSSVSARMEQEGRLCVLALGAFGVDMPAVDAYEAAPPAAPPPHAVARREPPKEAPPIAYRFDARQAFGAPPFSRAQHALVGGWLRLHEPQAVDAAALALYTDAWIPAPWPRLERLSPAPTIDLTIHFRAALPHAGLREDDYVLARFESTMARGGYFEEDGAVWAPDGTLLAQSRQLALLL